MKVMIGVEKECLVYDRNYRPVDIDIAKLPEELTVDFANHQLEIVAKPRDHTLLIERDINQLLRHEYFADKLIWPLSTPPRFNPNVLYNKLDKEYRRKLYEKYGVNLMLFCGIHFNYSNDLLVSREDYFKLIQSTYEYIPLLMQFTSFSPYSHVEQAGLKQIGKNYGFEDSLSLRASNTYGYANEKEDRIDFSTYQNYLLSREEVLKSGRLIDEREIYTKVRLKQNLKQNYIELRFIDLNPNYKSGISDEVMVLLEAALNYLSTKSVSEFDYLRCENQAEMVALHGLDKSQRLVIDGQEDSLKNHTIAFLDNLIEVEQLDLYKELLVNLKLKYINSHLDIDEMRKEIESHDLSLSDYAHIKIHKYEAFEPILPQYNLELSTKLIIEEAQKRDYQVEVLSERKNIIKVTHNDISKYLVQATKTNLDGYATVLLMEDKDVSKQILQNVGIKVPAGIKLSKNQTLNQKFDYKVVVKPLDTNFGVGITICDGKDVKGLATACSSAFKYSDDIIIEQFISGEEYRFLVIDNHVVSIVTRKNANVIGDGFSTIQQLIEFKNQSELRGVGYKRPLEVIVVDDDLKKMLKKQKYQINSIPSYGDKVILRNTSNVSQGGDSHEVSTLIPEHYKQIAVDAAAAFDAAICGVDMIIDLEKKDYAIIEVNYNPAIHMHTYPYRGIGRNVASKVLDALFKNIN